MASCKDDEGCHFLELSHDPVNFEPVSKVTNVFFDETNRQVFVVRSGGATGVVVKGPDPLSTTDFRMEDKGDVKSIKFAPDQKILAIHRCQKSVEFINYVNSTLDEVEYSQCCKGKNTQVLGFVWTCANEIVLITDRGVELYQVYPDKRTLKSLKTHQIDVNWFVYHPKTTLLVVSSGPLGNIIFPFQFRPGTMYRLPKFEVDLPIVPKPVRLCLLERDVTIATLYKSTCIVILRHQTRSGSNAGAAEIVLYTLQKEGPPRKTHILRLDMSGRFAVNVVDDLIIVHHQSSKSSLIFDIKLPAETDGYVSYHKPVVRPYPLKPFNLKAPTSTVADYGSTKCELYSPNWVIFQPDIIIDAKLGCLWHIDTILHPLVKLIKDKHLLVVFLLLRRNSKEVILNVCRSAIERESRDSLDNLAKIFDKLNQVLQQSSSNAEINDGKKPTIVIDQSDMFTHVFSAFEETANNLDYKFTIAVLLEYLRSLTQHQIQAQHFLYEMIINTMVQNRCFYQLHQFLQYHIFTDSKPLACLMLSLQSIYPAANQLAIDMLKRIGRANDEIVEVLLSQSRVLSALRFVRSAGTGDNISARKFLEAAQNCGSDQIYYATFKFFELRNLRLRGNKNFVPDDHCDLYVKHFETTFDKSTSLGGVFSAPG